MNPDCRFFLSGLILKILLPVALLAQPIHPKLVELPFVNCLTDTSAAFSFRIHPEPISAARPKGEMIIRDAFPWWNVRIAQEGCPSTGIWKTALPEGGTLVWGLKPDQTYTYTLEWTTDDSLPGRYASTFHTAPRPGSDIPFRFVVMSDSRGEGAGGVNKEVFQPLLKLAYKDSAAFILFPGDLVDGPFSDPRKLQRQFKAWQRIAQPVAAHIPIYTGMGNHDQMIKPIPGGAKNDYLPLSGYASGEEVFARNFANPQNGPDSAAADMPTYKENVYSFDYGPGHFVMLNTNYYQKGGGKLAADQSGDLQGTLRPEQLQWLDQDLQKARDRGAKYLFVAAHEPAFPNGGHSRDGMWWEGSRPEMNRQRDTFWQILCKYRVTAAFFGHEHNYSRMLVDSTINPAYNYPVWQIVTGGAGAPVYEQDEAVPWAGSVQAFFQRPHLCLVEISGGEVWLSVLTPEGEMLERVKLNK